MRVMDLRCRFGFHSWFTFSSPFPYGERFIVKVCTRCEAKEFGFGSL